MEYTLEDIVEFYLKHGKKREKHDKRKRNASLIDQNKEKWVSNFSKNKKPNQTIETENDRIINHSSGDQVQSQDKADSESLGQKGEKTSWVVKNFHHGYGQISTSKISGPCGVQSYDLDFYYSRQQKFQSIAYDLKPNSDYGSSAYDQTSASNYAKENSGNLSPLVHPTFQRNDDLFVEEFENPSDSNFWTLANNRATSTNKNCNQQNQNTSNYYSATGEDTNTPKRSTLPLSSFYKRNLEVQQTTDKVQHKNIAPKESKSLTNTAMTCETSSSSDSDSSGPIFQSKHLNKPTLAHRSHIQTPKTVARMKSSARVLTLNGPVKVFSDTSSDEFSSEETEHSFVTSIKQKSFISQKQRISIRKNLFDHPPRENQKAHDQVITTPLTSSRPIMFDEWVSIKEAFKNLYPFLEKNESDKVVLYVLNKNMPIRFMNAVMFTNKGAKDEINKICPSIKFKKFSSGTKGDDGKIINRWYELIREVPIRDPVRCFKDLSEAGKDVLKQRKRNVVGCYLGMDIQHIRLAVDIFRRCQTILEKRSLPQMGKAPDLQAISESNLSEGIFSYHEDKQILSHFFAHWNGQEETEYIRSISTKDLLPLANHMNRKLSAVERHWDVMIRPTLLGYYNKTLLISVRPKLCEYLIKKKVNAPKDINWDELLYLFPCETMRSLQFDLYSVVETFSKEFPEHGMLSLHEKIARVESTWRAHRLNMRAAANRERIIKNYQEIFGSGIIL